MVPPNIDASRRGLLPRMFHTWVERDAFVRVLLPLVRRQWVEGCRHRVLKQPELATVTYVSLASPCSMGWMGGGLPVRVVDPLLACHPATDTSTTCRQTHSQCLLQEGPRSVLLQDRSAAQAHLASADQGCGSCPSAGPTEEECCCSPTLPPWPVPRSLASEQSCSALA